MGENAVFESTFPQGLEAKGCFDCLENTPKYAPGGCTGVQGELDGVRGGGVGVGRGGDGSGGLAEVKRRRREKLSG